MSFFAIEKSHKKSSIFYYPIFEVSPKTEVTKSLILKKLPHFNVETEQNLNHQ